MAWLYVREHGLERGKVPVDVVERGNAHYWIVRKTGIPERGFRSRGRAKDLKAAGFARPRALLFHIKALRARF